jgi:predicted permease
MIRHNLLLIYRNFKRFKSTFIINLIGLSTGLACSLMIYLWVADELSVDQFYANKDRLFRVMEHRESSGEIKTYTSASGLLGESLAAEMPEVEYAINASQITPYTLSVGEKITTARGRFAGKDFFNMFSFDLVHGNAKQVLADKHSIVISEEVAANLFGTTHNVVGKSISLDHRDDYLVSGVFTKVPTSASEQFDFITSYEKYMEGKDWIREWANTATYAFVTLKKDADFNAFNRKLSEYIKLKTENKITHRTPFLKQYSKHYLYEPYENGVQAGGRITYVKLFSIIAIFILLIACINFMNLSTAKASRRIKEVGIKKAVGASRKTLILHYLFESLFMSFVSLLVAILMVDLLLPEFNKMTGKQLHIFLDTSLLLPAISITLITGLIAGSYPAFYLSGFNPAMVLKGKLNTSLGEMFARKGLVAFQFSLSIIFIVSVLVVYEQIRYIQSKPLGYDKNNIIYFPLVGSLRNMVNQESLLSEMKKLSGVENASSISHDMTGHSRGTYNIHWEGKDPNDKTEFEIFIVNYDMIETLGMEIAEGRSFSKDYGSEESKIVFNEAAIKYMGLHNPLGKSVRLWDEKEIIGVVKDFHFQSLHENIKPAFFYLDPSDTYLLMGKLSPGNEKETIGQIESLYKKHNPGFPFDFQFLDAAYQEQYMAEERVADLSKYFAAMAILISCLGLFGLAAFSAERRLKEVGIRKVLGSTQMGIIYLLSGDFTKIVFISIVIGLPLSYLLTQSWLSKFAFRIDLAWWYFAAAAFIALVVSLLTVGMQAFKASRVNPTRCLRDE